MKLKMSDIKTMINIIEGALYHLDKEEYPNSYNETLQLYNKLLKINNKEM